MIRSCDFSSADSSGDEGPLVIAEPPRKSRRRLTSPEKKIISSLSGGAPVLGRVQFSNAPRIQVVSAPGKPTAPPSSPLKPSLSSGTDPFPTKSVAQAQKDMLDTDERVWQKAMEVAVGICVPLKVDTKSLTLLPDAGTLECFKKACQAWLNEQKLFIPLTFSTQKSLVTVMARFLFDFVLKTSGLSPSDWNANGCVVWRHCCTGEDEEETGRASLRCLHGLRMINKDQVIEMDINSENAQRALKETPEKAKVTQNRWHRSVVQLKNEDAACCPFDLSTPAGAFSTKSCGMFFTEGRKALEAFKQIMAFQAACYPNMRSAKTHLLMPIKCECNWGQSLPLLGRQVCKITPFNLNAGTGIDKSTVENPKVLASLEHPAVLVFQCCNPVYRNAKGANQKNCDFKISATDLICAVQLAKQMWAALQKSAAPITIPEFKWDPSMCYQTAILPVDQNDPDDSLF